MALSIIDILFLVTVALLIFNGLKNGALFSLISLLVLPIGFMIAYYFGPSFAVWLASGSLNVTPLISYAVLFIGTILILHIVGNFLRSVLNVIPLFGTFDTLLGGVIGFIEAWLIWFILLFLLGTFLSDIQNGTSVPGIDFTQFVQHFQDWHVQDWFKFYNDAVAHSLFTQINDFFAGLLPILPQLPKLKPV